jgi:hypothetical protein
MPFKDKEDRKRYMRDYRAKCKPTINPLVNPVNPENGLSNDGKLKSLIDGLEEIRDHLNQPLWDEDEIREEAQRNEYKGSETV